MDDSVSYGGDVPGPTTDGSLSRRVPVPTQATNLRSATDYKVCFYVFGAATGGSADGTGYVDQCYNNQPTSGTLTSVTATPGVTTTGIDATLARGGAVSGTVTDAGGSLNALAHVLVDASSISTGSHQVDHTAADGSYTLKGLEAGTDYKVCFHSSGATGGSSDTAGYVDQCWQNQPASGTPTPVTLTSATVTTGINAALVGAG